jgi:hypothetical protein
MSILIRLLEEEELFYANSFFNEVYKTNRSYESFKWEFLNGPCGAAIYVAAIDESIKQELKIVGIQCAIPLIFVGNNDQKILTAKSEDTLVDPNYRGMQIFEKMYNLLFEECKKKGIKFIWGFTPAYKPFKKLGFNLDVKAKQELLVVNLFASFKFLSTINKQNKSIDKLKILLLCIFSFFKGLNRFFIKIDLSYKTTDFNSALNIKNINFFNLDKSTDKLFTLLQDEIFYKWRIIENSYNNEYFSLDFIDRQTNKICANLILNLRKEVSYIEQMVFSENLDIHRQKKIIAAAIIFLQKRNANLIRFLAFDSNPINKKEIQSLNEIGFVKLNRGNWFVWKCLDKDFNINPSSIFLSRLFTQGNI